MREPPAPAEAFLEVASVAWQQLPTTARKAIRAASRSGRLLHDSMLTHLQLDIKPSQDPPEDSETDDDGEDDEDEVEHRPTPAELQACVSGVVARGARLQALTLLVPWYNQENLKPSKREAKVLAVLDAVHDCPITSLDLVGGVPLSVAVSTAIGAHCQQLKTLIIDHNEWASELAYGAEEAPHSSCAAGVVRLLTDVGPRLRELEVLRSAHHWPAEAWGALRHCTGLTSLAVEAGWKDANDLDLGFCLGSVSAETHIIEAASHLTNLRSLGLRTTPDPNNITPQALAPHATSAFHLSALTGLTSLELQTTQCYESFPDSWALLHEEGDRHEAWVEVREAHRTAVLSALRAMPQLQQLSSATLWLRPPDVAHLTALTSLCAGGLLPPLPPPDDAGAAAGPVAGPAAARGGAAGGDEAEQPNASAWPPQLQQLVLYNGGSPRALAALELPSTLRCFACWAVCLGMSDVDEHGRILQETIDALGPAVQVVSRPETMRAEDKIEISVDCSHHTMHPRQDTPSGHVEWLLQLAGLGAFRSVELIGPVVLRAGDVACMVRMWSDVRCLKLMNVVLPVAALPLLSRMERLEELTVDLVRLEDIRPEELEAALCALCLQAGSSLQRVSVITDSALMDAAACEDAVQQQLHEWGREGLEVSVVQEGEDEEEYP